MASLNRTRGAQYPLVAELVMDFSTAASDTLVNTSGTRQALNAVQANVDYDAISVPPNAIVVGGEVSVESAVVGPTASTLSVGDPTLATRYANAVSLLAAARTALTLTGYVTDGADIRIRLNNTVAAATAGRVALRVMYTLRGRAHETASV